MDSGKRLAMESLECRRCLAALGFEAHAIVSDGNFPLGLEAHDFDRDGDVDLLSQDSEGRYRLFDNRPGLAAFELVAGLDERFLDGLFADIDGDGDDDLIAIATLPGDGDTAGELPDLVWIEDFNIQETPASIQFIVEDASPDLNEIRAFDFDSDGDVDVLSRAQATAGAVSDWAIHENTLGMFAAPTASGLDATFDWFWDRDGDGDFDALQMDPITDRLRVSENLEGEYQQAEVLLDDDGQPIVSLPFTSGSAIVFGFELADMDGDGDGDIVAFGSGSYSTGAYELFWYQQEADGTFRREVVLFEPVNDSNIVGTTIAELFDLDGDGDLDILTRKKADNQLAQVQVSSAELTWFENEGGSFAAEQTIASFGRQYPVAFHHEDFDGDGDRDLLMAMSDAPETVSIYEHLDGAGTYAFAASVLNRVEQPGAATAADLDGDGDLDLLGLSPATGYVFWAENRDGDGDFGGLRTIVEPMGSAAGASSGAASAVRASDLDGDGDLDVVVVQEFSDAIYWIENEDGLGSFGELQLVTDKPLWPSDVRMGDLDGDGDQDIVSITRQDGDLTWYRNKNDDDGFSSPRKIVDATTWSQEYTDLALADLDGDGDLDIVAVATSPLSELRGLWVLMNDGRANFDDPIRYDDAARLEALDVADVDGDGDLDISTIESNGEANWYENLGELGFGVKQTTATQTKAGQIELADMDGDGDTDMVISYSDDVSADVGQRGPGVGWLENLGGGASFAALQRITSRPLTKPLIRPELLSVDLADLDGDGDQDLLTSNPNNDSLQWFELVSVAGIEGWQNADLPTDVDGSGVVTPTDAIIVINELNDRVYTDSQGTFVDRERPDGAPFLDVDGDSRVSPTDALAIINVLNESSGLQAPMSAPQGIAVQRSWEDGLERREDEREQEASIRDTLFGRLFSVE